MTDPMANLAPLQSPRKSSASPTLSPKAAEFLGKVTVAADFAPHLDHSYVVKHWLNSTTMSVIYGDSNVGKTFFALDLARHVAGGIEWNGCRVTRPYSPARLLRPISPARLPLPGRSPFLPPRNAPG